MSTYHYRARDSNGKKLEGFVDAASEKSAAEELARRGLLVVEIKKSAERSKKTSISLFAKKISADELTMLFLQLGNMLKSGIPILKALETIGSSSENREVRHLVERLFSKVNGGLTLSEAMKREAAFFPALYTSMVEVGEASGSLGDVLGYIASLHEARSELNYQVSSAVAYPIVLLVATIAVAIFMVVWVLPSFISIFERSGIALPAPTQFLYSISIFLKRKYMLVLLALAAGVISFRAALLNKQFKLAWDGLCIKIPIVGNLVTKIELARWTKSLGLMLTSGVPILRALEVAMNLTTNLKFQECYRKTIISVEGGGKIGDALRKSDMIPSDIIQMISTGENSGSLDQMLGKVADFYDLLVKRALKRLTSALEPFFIVLMGVVVGFVMLSVLLPIFEMIKAFQSTK